jgi:uncharacterized protein
VPFLLIHGWHGSGPEHWQRWLGARLRDEGHEVACPDLPDPDEPQLGAWLEALLHELGGRRDWTVVCHSLGCVLWLHHAAARPAPVHRVLLNAPPSALAEVPSFFPAPLDADALATAAGTTRLVCSDDDPYCPEGADALYGRPLGLPVDLLPGRGHLNADSGLGPWPAMLEWCLGARASLADA